MFENTQKAKKNAFLIGQNKTKSEFSRKSFFSKQPTTQKQVIHFGSWMLAEVLCCKLVGALGPFKHKGLYQGWEKLS